MKLTRETWLAALRSGEYKQTKEYLHRLVGNQPEPRFCCLGVACELGMKDDLLDLTKERCGSAYAYRVHNLSTGTPPREVLQAIGFREDSLMKSVTIAEINKVLGRELELRDIGLVETDYVSVIVMNDQLDLTFSEIADVVEELM